MTLKTLCVFGTRPEAIKMAPLIKRLDANPSILNKNCTTGQHQQLIEPVLDLFGIKPDFDLQTMMANQDLCNLTSKILTGLSGIFKEYSPELVIVHGDTTTAFAVALAAYYYKIPIAHVEAGLRTGNIYSPWPEEANRKLISSLAVVHFAPTQLSQANLIEENIAPDTIHVTGNTVIDALYQMNQELEKKPEIGLLLKKQFPFLDKGKKMILVTGHRRENFGSGFERICQALLCIAKRFPDINIVYPVHLNPNVQEPVYSLLGNSNNIYLIPPADYLPFIYLMKSAYLILTDSGGIQEEAPSLGVPVLVMRENTERPEAVEAGTVRLVGSDTEKIVQGVEDLINNKTIYKQMSQAVNPYGDGNASMRIEEVIIKLYAKQSGSLISAF